MKTLLNILLVTTVFYVGAIQASNSISSGKAISLCKAEAQQQNNDYTSSKLSRIKNIRAGYKVNLRVVLADKSVASECIVSRDGSLEYKQS